jgi:hypothetical protein
MIDRIGLLSRVIHVAYSALIVQARAVLTLIVVGNLFVLDSPYEIESAGNRKSTMFMDNNSRWCSLITGIGWCILLLHAQRFHDISQGIMFPADEYV